LILSNEEETLNGKSNETKERNLIGGKYSCDICDYAATKKRDLKRHDMNMILILSTIFQGFMYLSF